MLTSLFRRGTGPHPPVASRLVGLTLLLAAVTYVASKVIHLGAHKAYAIDEFYYAHMAWMTTPSGGGLGQLVRSGDEFISKVIFYPAVLLGDDNPANMLYVRLSMLLLLAVTTLASAFIAQRSLSDTSVRALLAGLVVALLLLSCKGVIWFLVEIRPDGVAIFFTVCSVAVLFSRLPPRQRAIIAGLLLFLASMSSRKAFVYGTAFALVFCIDLYALLRRRPMALGQPLWFAAGYLAPWLVLVAYLAHWDSLDSFWNGFYVEAKVHQESYPEIEVKKYLHPFFRSTTLLWGLAGVGLFHLGRRARGLWRDGRGSSPELLLLFLFPATWASYVVQKAPWAYSLIPGGVLLCLTAAIGLCAIVDAAAQAQPTHQVVATALLVSTAAVVLTTVYVEYEPRHRNDRQIELHQQIHELTNVDDAIYDFSALYAYRPQAHRLAFLDTARKLRLKKSLQKEVPKAILKNEAVMFIYDFRFRGWRRTPLGRFLLENYQTYNDDLRIWGRRWKENRADWSDDFHAIKDGEYFIHPPAAASSGQLEIDGEQIQEPVVTLTKGKHRVKWTAGPLQPASVYLIWLPRNGEPFDPTRKSPSYFLGRHVLP